MQSTMVASQQQLLRKQSLLSTSPRTEVPVTPSSGNAAQSETEGVTNQDYVVIDSEDNRMQTASSHALGKDEESLGKRELPAPESPQIKHHSRPKKTRRNNPSSSWLGLINPSYKTRAEEFRKLFQEFIPSNERLVVDYSCALQKEILVHGRVYVTPNYICFYANIFKWETRVVIKCKDIDSINKTNTAKVIPNAIQINTHQGEKYTLTSFAARDKTYVMIFRVWQNALLGQSMSSSQLWQWIRCSYGDDLGFSSDEEEEAKEDFAAHLDRQKRFSSSTSGDDSPDVLGTKAKTSHTRPKRHVNIEEPIRENDAGIEGDDEVYEDQDESLPFLDPISCGCPDHKGKLLADVSLPIPVETTYKLIFSESKWYKNMMADRKAMKLQFTPWQECSDEEKCLTAKKKRVVTYTVVLNYAMLKSAPTIETQYLQEMRDGQVYKVQTQAVNTDIPYCDTFYVATQYCLTRGRQENETRVLIHSEVVITSNSWSFRVMRPIVEKNAQQGIADFINDLVSCLNKYCNDGPKEIVNEITEFAAAVDLEMMVPSASRSGSLDSRKSLRRRLGSGVTVEDTLAAERNMWSPMDEVRMNQLNSLKKSRSESLKNTGYVPQEGFVTLKIILGVLVALFISNMWLYFQLWKLESAADSYETLIRSSLESSAGRGTLSPSQDSVDALRIVLSRAIEMVKSLEQNLQDLNNDLKNKL